jgi:hypothetical protein
VQLRNPGLYGIPDIGLEVVSKVADMEVEQKAPVEQHLCPFSMGAGRGNVVGEYRWKARTRWSVDFRYHHMRVGGGDGMRHPEIGSPI